MANFTNNISNTTGIRIDKDACVVIIRTEWNAYTVGKLLEGCIRVLEEHNVCYELIEVPGAFEIPFAIKQYWEITKGTLREPQAFIALGCVLRGDTPHFEYVSGAVTDGIAQLNLQLRAPSIFGVLTVNDQVQADERTGGKHGHKGEEAAYTALKMMALISEIKQTPA